MGHSKQYARRPFVPFSRHDPKISKPIAQFLDPNRNSLPLYMDPENAFCPSIVSHNASTHNVLLKVTVPKRTGRKRKRGTNGPWEGDATLEGDGEQVSSHRRLDHPKTLLRKLQDNVDSYRVETAGVIKHTHRYRGSCSSFSQRSRSKLLTYDFV